VGLVLGCCRCLVRGEAGLERRPAAVGESGTEDETEDGEELIALAVGEPREESLLRR
jgi:hypothetical protein